MNQDDMQVKRINRMLEEINNTQNHFNNTLDTMTKQVDEIEKKLEDKEIKGKLELSNLELVEANKVFRVIKNSTVHALFTTFAVGSSLCFVHIQQELVPVIDSITTGIDHNSIKNCIIGISAFVIIGMNIKIKLNHMHEKYVEEHLSDNELDKKSYSEIKTLIKSKKQEIKRNKRDIDINSFE